LQYDPDDVEEHEFAMVNQSPVSAYVGALYFPTHRMATFERWGMLSADAGSALPLFSNWGPTHSPLALTVSSHSSLLPSLRACPTPSLCHFRCPLISMSSYCRSCSPSLVMEFGSRVESIGVCDRLRVDLASLSLSHTLVTHSLTPS
jgi:hypothetical protein